MLSSALLALVVAALGVSGTPVPQGETRLLSPSGAVPTDCKISYDGLFAIAAIKATDIPNASMGKRQVQQQPDGQPTPGPPAMTVPVVTQIGDAQPQAPTVTVPPVSQISDAQPQAPISTMMHTAISQIGDGQVQVFYTAVSQIGDAQPQAPVQTSAVSQIGDAQPQAPKPTKSVPAVSQAPDAQPQATTLKTKTIGATATVASGPAPSVSMVACKTDSTLELDLKNGRLLDGKGRVGYIAANYQFQFDAGVPQTGAIITTGFSVCSNGTLALGGSAVFWQCLSGEFYNLYDRKWAAQCDPVYLRVVGLKDC